MKEGPLNNPRRKESKTTEQAENVIYGNPAFERKEGARLVSELETEFKSFYIDRGYKEQPPVPITSGIDPSVRFIGSHISVFKPYLTADSIETPGYVMTQNCLRTQNASRMFDDEYMPRWGSFFTSLGSISPPERLTEVCKESAEYLSESVQIHPEHISIRVSSADEDLLAAAQSAYTAASFEVDTQQDSYYRHKIGIEGIWGRNFNIALRNANGQGFSDVGNIILIEQEDKQIGVELALGATTILKQIHNVGHVNDFYFIHGLPEGDPALVRKLEDSIVVCSVLRHERLQPSASDNRGRLFRTYLRSILYLKEKLGVTNEALHATIAAFNEAQFGESSSDTAEWIMSYIRDYRNQLVTAGPRSPEDKIVATALRNRP